MYLGSVLTCGGHSRGFIKGNCGQMWLQLI